MSNDLIIEVENRETRVALMEDHHLREIHFERSPQDQIVGNIYKGTVADVLPGMEAAFIHIGAEKNVFLHVSDARILKRSRKKSINRILTPGQEIMIQIAKEPLGGKGAKGTCDISLPGRYLVLMIRSRKVGISRRIDDEKERRRLKDLAHSIKPKDKGLIVRTVAMGKSEEELKHDLKELLEKWKRIEKKYNRVQSPYLLHQDLNLVQRIVRDLLGPSIDNIILNSKGEYKHLLRIIEDMAPQMTSRLHLYDKKRPIFSYYNVENELEKALKKKIWLKSGGYLILDYTEALVAIDVNTGKYVGKTDLEATVLKTNLEAAVEIARQLRLRDIGGIIIIDFIDMEDSSHQKQVLQRLEMELEKDRTKTTLLGLTSLGLVELTRKKEKESIREYLKKECPYCQGEGWVLSEETVALKAMKRLKELDFDDDCEAILVETHPQVASLLIGGGGRNLDQLEKELGKEIYVKGSENYHLEEINIYSGRREKIYRDATPVSVGEEYTLFVEDQHMSNPQNGVARVEGFVIDIDGAGHRVGEKVSVEIVQIEKTFAKGVLVE